MPQVWQEDTLKTLIYWRHSVKGTGEHSADIMQVGLDETLERIKNEWKKPGDWPIKRITHIFAGPIKRTWQTLAAVLVGLINHRTRYTSNLIHVHEEIPGIGDDNLFQAWKDAGVKLGPGRTNFQALNKDLTDSKFEAARVMAIHGVGKMFNMMTDGEIGLAIGHSPVIELAADLAGLKMVNEPQLKENEYIIFEMDEEGFITARYPS